MTHDHAFFVPTEAFVDWLVGYAAGRLIVDVGCGSGLLVERLRERTHKAVGIEIQTWKYEESPIGDFISSVPAERSVFVRAHGVLLIFARPCHGGWVERVMDTVGINSELLYIGFEKNVESDLGARQTEVVASPEPATGHIVRSYKPRHLERNKQNWMFLGDEWVRNSTGTVRVVSDRELDWKDAISTKEFRTIQTSRYGWISPSGKTYFCSWYEHERMGIQILGMETRELEELRWARMFTSGNWVSASIRSDDWIDLTDAQRAAVDAVNLKLNGTTDETAFLYPNGIPDETGEDELDE